MDAYICISIHDKVAIQCKGYYISINNLITLYWAVIYQALYVLSKPIKQQG
jgi:hypothetical protein